MILLKTLGDFHDAAAICGIVGRIASGDNGTDDVEVGLIVEVTVMGETVDGVTNLLDGMVDANTFQFDEQTDVLLRIDGVIAEEIVALVVGGIVVEVAVNLVLVDDGSVAAQDGELALALLYSEARGATALRCFEADGEVIRGMALRLLVETLTAHCRWQAVR